MEKLRENENFTDEDIRIRSEIFEALCIIDDTWVLTEILRFIKNITK